MPYDVQTPVYQGPFDLLLHLICRDEVDLWDVSLSSIVDAYVAEIERIGTLDLKIAAIAISHDALLLTRNLVDFAKVPGLRVENWLD